MFSKGIFLKEVIDMFSLQTPLSVIVYICFFGAVAVSLIQSIRAREKQKFAVFALALVWILVIGIYNLYMFRDMTFEEIRSNSRGEHIDNQIAYVALDISGHIDGYLNYLGDNDNLLGTQDSEILMDYISNLRFNRAFNMESSYHSDYDNHHYVIRMFDEQRNLILFMIVTEGCIFGSWRENSLIFYDRFNPLWVTRSDDGQSFYQFVENLYNQFTNPQMILN